MRSAAAGALLAFVAVLSPSFADGAVLTKGVLATQRGPDITDDRLRRMLDESIPTAESTLLVLLQCYAGDFLDDFSGRPGTTLLSATSPGELATYGGYDDDAVRALMPGATSGAVHAAGVAGKDPDEHPLAQGPDVALPPTDAAGPVRSRHVVIYAGQPEAEDVGYRDALKRSFLQRPGQNEAPTTVITVGDDARRGWDRPGTLAGLRDALRDVGRRMGPDEQFLLVVLDHGDEEKVDTAPTCSPAGCTSAPLPLGPTLHQQMQNDPGNVPAAILRSPGATPPPPVTIALGSQSFSGVPFADPVDVNGDGDLDDPGDGWEARVSLDEALIDPLGETVVVTGTGVVLNEIALGSGTIARLRRNPAGAPDDHFLCYRARPSRGGATPIGIPLVLTTAFETASANTGVPDGLCLPADKDAGGVVDADTHLERYRLVAVTPRHARRAGVRVRSQLGDAVVDTIRPTTLLVPTATGLLGPPSPPDDALHGVDHYTCYRVRPTRGEPKPLEGATVAVVEQFEAREYAVGKVTRLCAPVDKNGGGVKRPTGHLLCRRVRRLPGEPAHVRRVDLYVDNQFGPARLDTRHEDELCFPAVLP